MGTICFEEKGAMINMSWDDSRNVYFYFLEHRSYLTILDFFLQINGKRGMPIAICPCDAAMCNAASSGHQKASVGFLSGLISARRIEMPLSIPYLLFSQPVPFSSSS